MTHTDIKMPLKEITHNILAEIKNKFVIFPIDGRLLKTALSIKIKKENHDYEYVIGEYNEIKHEFRFDSKNFQTNQKNDMFVRITEDDGTIIERGVQLSVAVEDLFKVKKEDIKTPFELHVTDTLKEVKEAPQRIFFEKVQ